MNLKSKFIINSLIGFIIGMFVGIGFWVVTPCAESDRSLIIYVIVSGLHGLFPCGAATVFDIESWGLTKCTVVHALITLATILVIELPMKWWASIGEFTIALVIYVVIYVIIWLVNYLYWKHTVNEMNEQLRKIQSESSRRFRLN